MPQPQPTEAREKYGYPWKAGTSDLHIELMCFREGMSGPEINRAFHFKEIVRMLWGPNAKKRFIWNPWCEKMLACALAEKYLGLSGCASSGKTCFSAVWALVNWLCMPTKTTVLVTSTSLEDARGRVWGDVEAYYNAANDSLDKMQKGMRLPGKMISSTGKIRTQDGPHKYDEKSGIRLIAGDRAKEKENIGKLVGLKNERVFLIADELPELSPALANAARNNLMTNPHFQMIASGNFKSIYDPFGIFCEPEGGWGSVSPEFESWKTKDGLCLRFDGMKSPNILLGEQRYPGMYGPEHLENHKKEGEHTGNFWRMCRSFPCPEADADRIYSESDLVKGDVRSLVKWASMPVDVAALDPAFATGGDRAMGYFGKLGISVDGKQTLQIVERKEYREDIRKKDENRSVQVAKAFIADCKARNIKEENVAYDESGGGLPFGGLIGELWSRKPLGVQFGGGASDRAASSKDHRKAKEAFANRVSEIWFAGVEFVQSGQIKGLPSEACVELTERRKLDGVKGGAGVKNRVESKKDMKARTGGKSPDDADAFLILLELCRVRLNFKATGMEGKRAQVNVSWKQRVAVANRIHQNVNYEPEEQAA